jgi:uncharacterized protein
MKSFSLYESALKKMKEENPDKEQVFQLLLDAHESGDIHATYALSTWYLHGEHVDKNINKAISLLNDAADKNVPNALYDLAVCYEKGEGVECDSSEAFRLYLKAALRGDEQSVYEVGRCYYYGIGASEDRRLADIWLDRAEELGIKEL